MGWMAQVGGYAEGQRRGCGIYSFPNGDRYEGECTADAPHGHGVYRFAASGAVLEGTWAAGAKQGWAVITVGSQQSYGAVFSLTKMSSLTRRAGLPAPGFPR